MPLLAEAGLPPLRGSQLFSTQFNAIPVLMILIALVAYLLGVRTVRRLHPRHRWPLGRTIAWIGALGVTAISIFSFIGVYDTELFWDHMVQHLALIMVAAPLFAVASPIDLAFRATSGRAHRTIARLLRSHVAKFFGHPLVAFGIYAVVIPITHLTSLYNYTLLHGSVEDAEHLLYLVVGYLFWRHVFGSDPNQYRLHPALQFGFLFLAIPIDTFTGLSLDNAVKEMFPAYIAQHRTWGPPPVQDLHIGGILMWVAGDTLMLWPMIPIALRWLHMEERRGDRADRELATAGYDPSSADYDPSSEVSVPSWVRPIDLAGGDRPSA